MMNPIAQNHRIIMRMVPPPKPHHPPSTIGHRPPRIAPPPRPRVSHPPSTIHHRPPRTPHHRPSPLHHRPPRAPSSKIKNNQNCMMNPTAQNPRTLMRISPTAKRHESRPPDRRATSHER